MGQSFEDFDKASNHPYECRCEVCLDWWRELGPDGGEPGNFGPFTEEEIEEGNANGEVRS